MNETSSASIVSAVSICAAIGETIRELGSVPSGILYANLMGKMNLDQYQKVIALLKRTGLVTESNHVLTWSGPVIPKV